MMKHYYQTTNVACVQAATAILLSAFNIDKTPEDIITDVPTRPWPGTTEPAGTPNQDAATYICKLGLNVEIISFDTWVTDQSWIGKDVAYIKDRLQAAMGNLVAQPIGKESTDLYLQAYLDFIDAGGVLSVQAAASSSLLAELVNQHPVMTTVAYNTLHGAGKSINGPGLYETRDDDIKGKSPNHNIVITKFEGGKFEFYDPWKKPGIHWASADRLIAAISTAQQECDNMIIVVRPKS